MKKIAYSLTALLFTAFLLIGCEPKECKQFKDAVCTACGDNSAACKSVKKRRGRDEKKCKQGLSYVEARTKDKTTKTLCTLLNSDLKKTKK